MAAMVKLQNLPRSASALDIRDFFSGLPIPDRGIKIVGGEKEEAFVAFNSHSDARAALNLSGRSLKHNRVKLDLSDAREMHKTIEFVILKKAATYAADNPDCKALERLAKLNNTHGRSVSLETDVSHMRHEKHSSAPSKFENRSRSSSSQRSDYKNPDKTIPHKETERHKYSVGTSNSKSKYGEVELNVSDHRITQHNWRQEPKSSNHRSTSAGDRYRERSRKDNYDTQPSTISSPDYDRNVSKSQNRRYSSEDQSTTHRYVGDPRLNRSDKHRTESRRELDINHRSESRWRESSERHETKASHTDNHRGGSSRSDKSDKRLKSSTLSIANYKERKQRSQSSARDYHHHHQSSPCLDTDQSSDDLVHKASPGSADETRPQSGSRQSTRTDNLVHKVSPGSANETRPQSGSRQSASTGNVVHKASPGSANETRPQNGSRQSANTGNVVHKASPGSADETQPENGSRQSTKESSFENATNHTQAARRLDEANATLEDSANNHADSLQTSECVNTSSEVQTLTSPASASSTIPSESVPETEKAVLNSNRSWLKNLASLVNRAKSSLTENRTVESVEQGTICVDTPTADKENIFRENNPNLKGIEDLKSNVERLDSTVLSTQITSKMDCPSTPRNSDVQKDKTGGLDMESSVQEHPMMNKSSAVHLNPENSSPLVSCSALVTASLDVSDKEMELAFNIRTPNIPETTYQECTIPAPAQWPNDIDDCPDSQPLVIDETAPTTTAYNTLPLNVAPNASSTITVPEQAQTGIGNCQEQPLTATTPIDNENEEDSDDSCEWLSDGVGEIEISHYERSKRIIELYELDKIDPEESVGPTFDKPVLPNEGSKPGLSDMNSCDSVTVNIIRRCIPDSGVTDVDIHVVNRSNVKPAMADSFERCIGVATCNPKQMDLVKKLTNDALDLPQESISGAPSRINVCSLPGSVSDVDILALFKGIDIQPQFSTNESGGSDCRRVVIDSEISVVDNEKDTLAPILPRVCGKSMESGADIRRVVVTDDVVDLTNSDLSGSESESVPGKTDRDVRLVKLTSKRSSNTPERIGKKQQNSPQHQLQQTGKELLSTPEKRVKKLHLLTSPSHLIQRTTKELLSLLDDPSPTNGKVAGSSLDTVPDKQQSVEHPISQKSINSPSTQCKGISKSSVLENKIVQNAYTGQSTTVTDDVTDLNKQPKVIDNGVLDVQKPSAPRAASKTSSNTSEIALAKVATGKPIDTKDNLNNSVMITASDQTWVSDMQTSSKPVGEGIINADVSKGILHTTMAIEKNVNTVKADVSKDRSKTMTTVTKGIVNVGKHKPRTPMKNDKLISKPPTPKGKDIIRQQIIFSKRKDGKSSKVISSGAKQNGGSRPVLDYGDVFSDASDKEMTKSPVVAKRNDTFCVEITNIPSSTTKSVVMSFFQGLCVTPGAIHFKSTSYEESNSCFVELLNKNDLERAKRFSGKTISSNVVTIREIEKQKMLETLHKSSPSIVSKRTSPVSAGVPNTRNITAPSHQAGDVRVVVIANDNSGRPTKCRSPFGENLSIQVLTDQIDISNHSNIVNEKITTASSIEKDSTESLQTSSEKPRGSFCVEVVNIPLGSTKSVIMSFFKGICVVPGAVHIVTNPDSKDHPLCFVELLNGRELTKALSFSSSLMLSRVVTVREIKKGVMLEKLGPHGPTPINNRSDGSKESSRKVIHKYGVKNGQAKSIVAENAAKGKLDGFCVEVLNIPPSSTKTIILNFFKGICVVPGAVHISPSGDWKNSPMCFVELLNESDRAKAISFSGRSIFSHIVTVREIGKIQMRERLTKTPTPTNETVRGLPISQVNSLKDPRIERGITTGNENVQRKTTQTEPGGANNAFVSSRKMEICYGESVIPKHQDRSTKQLESILNACAPPTCKHSPPKDNIHSNATQTSVEPRVSLVIHKNTTPETSERQDTSENRSLYGGVNIPTRVTTTNKSQIDQKNQRSGDRISPLETVPCTVLARNEQRKTDVGINLGASSPDEKGKEANGINLAVSLNSQTNDGKQENVKVATPRKQTTVDFSKKPERHYRPAVDYSDIVSVSPEGKGSAAANSDPRNSFCVELKNFPKYVTKLNIMNFFKGICVAPGAVHLLENSDQSSLCFVELMTRSDLEKAKRFSGKKLNSKTVTIIEVAKHHMLERMTGKKKVITPEKRGNGNEHKGLPPANLASPANQDVRQISVAKNLFSKDGENGKGKSHQSQSVTITPHGRGPYVFIQGLDYSVSFDSIREYFSLIGVSVEGIRKAKTLFDANVIIRVQNLVQRDHAINHARSYPWELRSLSARIARGQQGTIPKDTALKGEKQTADTPLTTISTWGRDISVTPLVNETVFKPVLSSSPEADESIDKKLDVDNGKGNGDSAQNDAYDPEEPTLSDPDICAYDPEEPTLSDSDMSLDSGDNFPTIEVPSPLDKKTYDGAQRAALPCETPQHVCNSTENNDVTKINSTEKVTETVAAPVRKTISTIITRFPALTPSKTVPQVLPTPNKTLTIIDPINTPLVCMFGAGKFKDLLGFPADSSDTCIRLTGVSHIATLEDVMRMFKDCAVPSLIKMYNHDPHNYPGGVVYLRMEDTKARESVLRCKMLQLYDEFITPRRCSQREFNNAVHPMFVKLSRENDEKTSNSWLRLSNLAPILTTFSIYKIFNTAHFDISSVFLEHENGDPRNGLSGEGYIKVGEKSAVKDILVLDQKLKARNYKIGINRILGAEVIRRMYSRACGVRVSPYSTKEKVVAGRKSHCIELKTCSPRLVEDDVLEVLKDIPYEQDGLHILRRNDDLLTGDCFVEIANEVDVTRALERSGGFSRGFRVRVDEIQRDEMLSRLGVSCLQHNIERHCPHQKQFDERGSSDKKAPTVGPGDLRLLLEKKLGGTTTKRKSRFENSGQMNANIATAQVNANIVPPGRSNKADWDAAYKTSTQSKLDTSNVNAEPSKTENTLTVGPTTLKAKSSKNEWETTYVNRGKKRKPAATSDTSSTQRKRLDNSGNVQEISTKSIPTFNPSVASVPIAPIFKEIDSTSNQKKCGVKRKLDNSDENSLCKKRASESPMPNGESVVVGEKQTEQENCNYPRKWLWRFNAFISNLPPHVTRKELAMFFTTSEYTVRKKDVHLPRSGTNGGYLRFLSKYACNKTAQSTRALRGYVIKINILPENVESDDAIKAGEVSVKAKEVSVKSPTEFHLEIGNLPPSATAEAIVHHLKRSHIENVTTENVKLDHIYGVSLNGCTGIGYITLSDEAAYKKLSTLDKEMCIHGHIINVKEIATGVSKSQIATTFMRTLSSGPHPNAIHAYSRTSYTVCVELKISRPLFSKRDIESLLVGRDVASNGVHILKTNSGVISECFIEFLRATDANDVHCQRLWNGLVTCRYISRNEMLFRLGLLLYDQSMSHNKTREKVIDNYVAAHCAVHIANIPNHVTRHQLLDLFAQFVPVNETLLLRVSNRYVNEADLAFASPTLATRAMNATNNRYFGGYLMKLSPQLDPLRLR